MDGRRIQGTELLRQYLRQYSVKETPSSKKKYTVPRWRFWYVVLVFLRLALIFIPQTGYVHPDEFFQSLEIINGDFFEFEHVRAWEFNSSMPLRSMALPYFLMRIPWIFFEIAAMCIEQNIFIPVFSSYTFLVFPRLIFGIISFVNDWSIYNICKIYELNGPVRLLTLASSWIMLVFGTRTFTNSLEMALASLLLYMVLECMITTNTTVCKKEFLDIKYHEAMSIGERVRIWKLKNSLPAHNYRRIFMMSSICVAGVFNRPTFLLFGAPMVFYWLLRGMGTRTINFFHFHLRMLLFCLCAIPTICFFIITDSLYYQYLTLGEIHSMDIRIENFVFTPWNFIRYNLDEKKRAIHGIHSHYQHLLVNLPMLFGPLAVITVVSLAQILYRFCRADYQGLPRTQSLVSVMSASILVPLISLSLINHQEARFLIPLIFPIIVLHSPKLVTGFCARYPFKVPTRPLIWLYRNFLCTRASAKFVFRFWCLANITLTLFFGVLHQGGFLPLVAHFEKSMQRKCSDEQFHLITSHVYNIPVSLLHMPKNPQQFNDDQLRFYRPFAIRKRLFLYEYGSLNMTLLKTKIKLIASQCEKKDRTRAIPQRLFVALPTIFCPPDQEPTEICSPFNITQVTFDFHHQQTFYAHLSTEALWQHYIESNTFDWRLPQEFPNFSTTKKNLWKLWQNLGLSLYEIKWRHIVITLECQLNDKKELQTF